METTKYNLEYFIKKFESIPDNQWTDSGNFVDDSGCKCAYGHCGVVADARETEEGKALNSLSYDIIRVNDNISGIYSYLGSTPKERIINHLKSLL